MTKSKTFFKKYQIPIFLVSMFCVFFSLIWSIKTYAISLDDFQIISFSDANGDGKIDILDIIDTARNILINIAPALATLVIIWGGYQYFFSGTIDGQKDGLKTVQGAVIGLVLVLLAGFIVQLIRNTVGTGTLDINSISKSIANLIYNDVVGFLVAISSVIAVLVMVLGGYKYMFSGTPLAKEDGKDTLIKGSIGLAVILLARPIVIIIAGLAGVTLTDNNISNGNVAVSTGLNISQIFSASSTSITNFIRLIVGGFLIPLSSIISVFFITLAGYYWLTSQGQESQITKAKDSIRNALIGLVIVLFASTIVQLIIFFTGSI